MERQFPCHSECSLGTSSLSITWELVRGADTLRLHPDLCLRICPESASPGDPFACEGLRTMALEQLFSTLVAHQNPLGRFKNLGILGSCPSPTAGRGSRVTSNAATLEDSSSPTLSMALTSAGEPSAGAPAGTLPGGPSTVLTHKDKELLQACCLHRAGSGSARGHQRVLVCGLVAGAGHTASLVGERGLVTWIQSPSERCLLQYRLRAA